MVVGAAPVRDNDPVVSPVVSQNISEKMCVFVGICSVDLIVTGHDRFCAAFFHGNLKSGQIDFTKSTLIYHRVHCHSAKLLAVYGKVLRAGIDAPALDSAYISRRHLACKIRIFGEILKVSSTERTSLYIESRTEHYMHALYTCLFAERFSDLLAQFGIPAVGYRCRSRETSRGKRRV